MIVPSAQRLEVARQDLRRSRLVPDPDAARPIAPGEARLRVDAFALTANNVTYAAFGDSMHYWEFFPTGDPAWGCIPVWGFAEVVESRADGVAAGERLYGYLPMGRYLVVQPGKVGARGFVDGAAHRAALPAVYNQFVRCAADPGYDRDREAQQALLKPLFTTSFLIDDFLAEQGFFGATQVLLSSASSKTAYGTAFCLSMRRGGDAAVRVVGCSSAPNHAFCRSLGVYEDVIGYDDLSAIDARTPTVYVDFSGDAPFRRRVHEHFGQALRYSCSVGGTHWDALGGGGDLPGPRPTLFFAPARIAQRSAPPPAGWGAAGLADRITKAWQAFMQPVCDPHRPWLAVRRAAGPQAAGELLARMIDGQVDPREGWMLSM